MLCKKLFFISKFTFHLQLKRMFKHRTQLYILYVCMYLNYEYILSLQRINENREISKILKILCLKYASIKDLKILFDSNKNMFPCSSSYSV